MPRRRRPLHLEHPSFPAGVSARGGTVLAAQVLALDLPLGGDLVIEAGEEFTVYEDTPHFLTSKSAPSGQ